MTNRFQQLLLAMALASMAFLTFNGCTSHRGNQTNLPPINIGGQRDAHGCLSAAGQTWSSLKQQCVQTFNVADIRFDQQKNATTYSVDVILSDDRQQAEVFAIDVPPNTILTAVKGGYVSADGNLRLLNTDRGWRLLAQ